MPYDIDAETSETKSGKPVKRVRFSDEVQNVYDIEGSDKNSGSISVENESSGSYIKTSVAPECDEFLAEEENIHIKTVNEDVIRSISVAYVDEFNELPSYYTEDVSEPANSYSDDIISQDSENSISDTSECIPSGSNSVTNALDELINDTMHMTISPARPVVTPNHFPSIGELSLCSSPSEANPEKKVQAIVEPSEQKNGVTSLSRKRSLEGMLIEKQTSKLNTCLRRDNSEISSADELKNAVYNAWYKVKNEKTSSGSQFIPEVKQINDSAQKANSHDAYETWKRSKRKAKKMSPTKKMSHKTSEPVSGRTQEDIEESKMECS